ncbi:hypothetical protein [Photorhabdus temperata]|uniref:hypothetical protein n=1 Tax=Photorhabdus temperata TaxID=574560 RepID=UPI0013E3B65B|nr:hypothetical protein [Photorhabdus temperata]
MMNSKRQQPLATSRLRTLAETGNSVRLMSFKALCLNSIKVSMSVSFTLQSLADYSARSLSVLMMLVA